MHVHGDVLTENDAHKKWVDAIVEFTKHKSFTRFSMDTYQFSLSFSEKAVRDHIVPCLVGLRVAASAAAEAGLSDPLTRFKTPEHLDADTLNFMDKVLLRDKVFGNHLQIAAQAMLSSSVELGVIDHRGGEDYMDIIKNTMDRRKYDLGLT